MTLLEVPEGAAAEVVAVRGQAKLAERLRGFGVHVGRRVRLVRAAPFSGPLLLEDTASGARFMIARSLAKHVEVQHDDVRVR